MTQHKQSHRIKWLDHYIKWHDMTCHVATNQSSSPHVASQPTTLLHLTPQATSWHQNRSHYHRGTAESSFTAKKWFGHGPGRSPCAHSIGKFFLCYIVLFSSETSAPGSPGNYLHTWHDVTYLWYVFQRFLHSMTLQGQCRHWQFLLLKECALHIIVSTWRGALKGFFERSRIPNLGSAVFFWCVAGLKVLGRACQFARFRVVSLPSFSLLPFHLCQLGMVRTPITLVLQVLLGIVFIFAGAQHTWATWACMFLN